MKGVLIWLFGSILAFLLTAGAFLVLANLSSSLPSRNADPKPAPSNSGPPLQLELSEARLGSLKKKADQTLPLKVTNAGETSLSKINLTMRVTTEDTSQPEPRYYRATIKGLAQADSKTVRFTIDLSSSKTSGRERTVSSSSDSLSPRSVLEVQATTPQGVSAIKTAVLPL